MSDWMKSPGHQKSILNPNYRKVNIGAGVGAIQQRIGAAFRGG